MALFFLFFLFSYLRLCSAALTSVTANQSISGDQTLTSADGLFRLGFFKPGKSPYYYLGIYYSLDRVSQLTTVWVANRRTPIADHTKAHLTISDDGNLVLSNSSNPFIWSTNTTISSSSAVAVLLGTGNLVLKVGSTTVWQSVDHVTNTWLPGGKLGLNKVTGELQRLTSWKSDDDPAPGIFSLTIDANGSSQYFIYWNESFNYWSSGTWNGRIFSLVPEMTANYIYDFEYVSNSTENYFTYSIKNSSNFISRFVMDVSGQIKQLTWVVKSNSWILFWSQPRLQCQVHALCGPFGSCNENRLPYCNCIRGFGENTPADWSVSNWAGGCLRNSPLNCGGNGSDSKAERDRFYAMAGVRLPASGQSLQAGSAAECESGCLSNCSCTAYSYGTDGRCQVWHGGLLNLQDQYAASDGGTVLIRLAASEFPGPKSKMGVAVGAIAGGVAVIVIIAAACLLIWWWKKKRGMSGKTRVVEGGLVAFRYADLQRATKNFSEKLGGGGFGSVFKGVLPDSSYIAVKKLEGIQQGEKQFRTEVSTIGTIQHVNLVRLRGFCSEGRKRLLVYEYMPNGSLDTQLFNDLSGNGKSLDWKTRYQIVLGTARGLTYLHEQCRDCIVHCDIKPENILLDAAFVPKVADFGLAKLIGRDFSRVLTTMRGTRGYLAPEWISGVAITAKADVYSYGMMLFEIISGKRNSEHNAEGKRLGFFPALAAGKLMEGDAIALLDGRLAGEADVEEVTRACKVACWCIQDDENARPTMGQVVQILEGMIEVELPPVPRAVQLLAEPPGNIVFFTELSSSHTSSTQTTTSDANSSSHTKSSSSLNS